MRIGERDQPGQGHRRDERVVVQEEHVSSASPASAAWLLARANPTFSAFRIKTTSGNSCATISAAPSVDALSTTMTSTIHALGSVKERRQARAQVIAAVPVGDADRDIRTGNSSANMPRGTGLRPHRGLGAAATGSSVGARVEDMRPSVVQIVPPSVEARGKLRKRGCLSTDRANGVNRKPHA